MSWTRWFRSGQQRARGARSDDRTLRRAFRRLLELERLEDRTVPSLSAVSYASTLSDTAAGNVTGPASVSKDGRYVVYTDTAANLSPGQVMDSKTASDVFLYDRSTGATTLISYAAGLTNTTTTAHGTSRNAAISADGKWIAYVSNSDNLVSNETLSNDSYTLSYFGAAAGTFALTYAGNTATLNYNATASDIQTALAKLPGVGTGNVTVSGSGPYTITFTGSLAHGASSPLTSDGGVNLTDSSGFPLTTFAFYGVHNEFLCDQYWVFLYDVQNGTNTLVSHAASDQGTGYATMAADGSSGLLAGDGVNLLNVLSTQQLSVSISGHGEYVTYVSSGTHLMVGQQVGFINPTNPSMLSQSDAFVYDRVNDKNILVSHSSTDSTGATTPQAGGSAYSAVIDQAGDTIAFTALAGDLDPKVVDNQDGGDFVPGTYEQLFVATLNSGSWTNATIAIASHEFGHVHADSTANGSSLGDLPIMPAPAITPDGKWIAYTSMGDDIVGLVNGGGDPGVQIDNVYLYDNSADANNATNFLVSHQYGAAATAGDNDTNIDTATSVPFMTPAVSDDGRYVAFLSSATMLTSTTSAAGVNVFLYDSNGKVDSTHNNVTRITQKSIPADSIPLYLGNAGSFSANPLSPSISGDGRYVAYIGPATTDIAGLTSVNNLPGSKGLDALLYDQGSNPGTSTPTYTLLSHDYSSTTTTGTGEAYAPVIDESGTTVTFLDDSDNLINPTPPSVPAGATAYTGLDLNAALPTDGTDLYAYSLNTPPAGTYTPQAANGTNATVTLRDPNLPNLNGNGLSEVSPIHAVSDDGRFVVWISNAPNIVANETDSSLTLNVYLYDKTTGKNTLLSHAAGSSTTTANDESANAVISGDGSTVLFYSFATNLISGETFAGTAGKDAELYLYNVTTGNLTLVSHTLGNASQAANDTAPLLPNYPTTTLIYSNALAQGLALPSVSSDGQYIAYLSNANDLSGSNTALTGSIAKASDPFFAPIVITSNSHGLRTGDEVLITGNSVANGTWTITVIDANSFSLDGSFGSGGSDVTGGTWTANVLNAFLYDRGADTNTMITHGNGGTASGNGNSDTVAISADGSTVAFTSLATNLLSAGAITTTDDQLYVWSRIDNSSVTGLLKGQVQLASHAASGNSSAATFVTGTDPNTGLPTSTGSSSWGPLPASLSSTGTYVAYYFGGKDLVSGQSGTAAATNVFRYDVKNNQNFLVTHTSNSSNTSVAGDNSTNANLYEASGPAISSDGRFIAYANNSTNLLATALTGQNGRDNVYLWDANATLGQDNILVSHADGSGGANNPDSGGGTSPSLAVVTGNHVFVSFVDFAIDTTADVDCTFSPNAFVRLYDSQATVTTQAAVVGGVFNPTPLILVGATLAPTDLSADGTTTVWDGLASDVAPVPGDRNGNLDVFISSSSVAVPAKIVVSAGDSQSATVATDFATALQAKVTDASNNPVSGATVTFTITAGTTGASGTFTGSATTVTATTGNDGIATAATLTAGTVTGSFTVAATVSPVATAATFTLTNTAGSPASITATTSTSQPVQVANVLTNALDVVVKDTYGNVVPNATVTFTITAGSTGATGTFTGNATTLTATTDSSGVAVAPDITAGTVTGAYTVTASVTGTSQTFTVTFTLTNTPGSPATLTATATSADVTVNTTLTNALSLTVADTYGNVVPNTTVTFTITSTTSANGTFTGNATTATATTDSNGIATVPDITANKVTGSYTVTPSVTGVTSALAFTVTNTADVPASITNATPLTQSLTVNTVLTNALQVTIEDTYNNLVPNATVTFTITSSSGATGTFAGGVTTITATTDSNGVATAPDITANKVTGSFTVTASVGGVSGTVAFAVTNTAGAPASITAASSTTQTVTVNTTLTNALQVTIKDTYNNLVPNATVTFTITSSSSANGTFAGGVTTITATTGADGVATAPDITANKVTGSYTVTPSVTGVTSALAFTVTNTADVPASITNATPLTQSLTVNTVLTNALQVTIEDTYNNLVPNATVTFTITSSSGATGTFAGGVTTITATTDSNGVATAPDITANKVTGSFTVTASVGGVSGTVAFAVTNTAGTPASITAASSTTQNVTVNTVLTNALQVTIKDTYGNGVPNTTVTFTITSSSGATGTFAGGVTTITATTGADGVATAPDITTNKVTGSYTVTPSVTGVTSALAFTVTNTADVPATITNATASSQDVTVANVLSNALQVTVQDTYGNAEGAGITVTFTIASSSSASGTFAGGVTTITATTNGSGVATAPDITANTVTGSYTVTASVSGVSSTTSFTITNTAGAPASITAASATTQTVTGNTTLTNALLVTIKDTYNNLVPNATVTFTVAASGGASGTFAGLTTATATTDAGGVATAPDLTANKVAGSYTVTASVGGVSSTIIFNVTNLAGSPASVTASSSASANVTVNSVLSNALQVLVTDANGNLVAPTTVTFTITSSSTANGTFAGGATTATATTNAGAVATAPDITANKVTGSYTVTASVGGVSGTVAFTVTNTAGTPASIAAATASPQTLTVATVASNAFAVTVKDGFGNLVPGATVNFAVATNTAATGTFAGGVTKTTATTDAGGVATAPDFTPNTKVGTYIVTAAVSGVSQTIVFNVINAPGAATTVTATGGTPQSVAVTGGFSTLQAAVTDVYGNAEVAGVVVTFTAPVSGAGGTFAGGVTTATTDGSGNVSAPAFTANTVAGSYGVTASVSGGTTSASFDLTNLPGPAAVVSATAGSGQSATVANAFGTALQVAVTDTYGNAEGAGITVTFTAPATGAGGGFAGTNTAITDASGIATAPTFTANTVAGNYSVSASVSGGTTAASFNLTNLPGTAANVVVVAGSGQSTAIGTAFATALQAQVQDAYHNAEGAGITVTFAAPTSGAGGTFAGIGTATTNASGIATAPTFTANTVAGIYSVTASTAGVTPVASFTLTNLPGTPSAISIVSGSGQTATVYTNFAAPLVALVTDAHGNVVPGTPVTFTAPVAGPGASFGGSATATVATGAASTAASPKLTANGAAGSYTVLATAPGVPNPAVFTLTNAAAVVTAISADTYADPSYASVPLGTSVGGAGPTRIVGVNAFPTIQQAVNATSPGGTVHVDPATYNEAVTVPSPLTIQGNAPANTVLQGPGSGTGITVTAPGSVTLADLFIQGFAVGVSANSSTAALTLADVQLIGDASGGKLTGVGMFQWTSTTPAATFSADASQFYQVGESAVQYTSVGAIRVNGAGGGDTYFVQFGGLGTMPVQINGSGNDIGVVYGTAAAEAVAITNTSVLDNGQVVTYAGLKQLTVGTGGGTDNVAVYRSAPTATVITVDAGTDTNVFAVDLSGAPSTGVVALTSNSVTSSVLGAPIFYKAVAGNLGGGVFLATGAGNDLVDVQSTVAGTTTTVDTNGGNDTIIVSSTMDLPHGTLAGLVGKLFVDAGSGANTLIVDDAGQSLPNTLWVTDSGIAGTVRPFQIFYASTGGTYGGGVLLTLDSGGDTVNVQNEAAASPMSIYGNGGDDTFNVLATTGAVFTNLTLDGGIGANSLSASDLSGGAVIHNVATGAASGVVVLDYLDRTESRITYVSFQGVGGSVDPNTAFILALYHDTLNENPTADQLNAALAVLNTQGRQAAAALVDQDPTAREQIVLGWYQTYLGHPPVDGGDQFWANKLATETQEQALSEFLATDEYYAKAGGTDAGFIAQLYKDLLNQTLTPDQIAAIQTGLLPRVGRSGLAWLVLTGGDFRILAVQQLSQAILGHPATQAMLDAFSSMDLASIAAAIKASDEFYLSGI